ncbi:MAG: Crp/Fnr family transcriptional regulator [Cyanobacteria bacterium J06642_11]
MALALHLSPSKSIRPTKSSVKPVSRAAQMARFKRHDLLPTRDNGFWRIESGYVRTFTWSHDGEAIPLGFWTTGDLVGQPIAQASPYEAQCLGPVTANYLGSTYAFPQAAVLAQVRQSNELLRIAHCRQTDLSLLQFLCWLAQRFGYPTKEGYEIPLKLIHRDIAESVGCTRVTISRLLKELEREGHIRWSVYEKEFHTPP